MVFMSRIIQFANEVPTEAWHSSKVVAVTIGLIIAMRSARGFIWNMDSTVQMIYETSMDELLILIEHQKTTFI